ncbi:hypothetical protein BDZ85DRAFT_71296 [Elsinoe ampelina]|uniref:Uncharacterized protein n=1 Tax=Elsinoe ampelina TaxID=302913 RepID=A0A6A6GJD2_9PEZI|nr:hypothetical protein BDZ85DRAFT_71296 [Elsinoe ampelina]
MDPRRPSGPSVQQSINIEDDPPVTTAPTAHMYEARSNTSQTAATAEAEATAATTAATTADTTHPATDGSEVPDASAQIVDMLTGNTLKGRPWNEVGPAATSAFVARYRDLVSDLPLTMNTVRVLVVCVLTYKGEIPQRVYTARTVRCIAALYIAILRSQMLVGRMGGEARTQELPSIAYANLAIRSAIDWGLGDLDTSLGPPVVTLQNLLEATAFVRHRQTSRNDELARIVVVSRNDPIALEQALILLENPARCKPGSLPRSKLPPPRLDALLAWVQHHWVRQFGTQGR